MVFLKTDEAFTLVLFKYTNFINIFSKNLAVKFSEYTWINNHAINLTQN